MDPIRQPTCSKRPLFKCPGYSVSHIHSYHVFQAIAAVCQDKAHHEVRGKGTILLGEDETPVERLARLILNRFGYAVIVADCAACALAIWEQESSKIDLLLTDMVMPGGMLKAAFNELTQDI